MWQLYGVSRMFDLSSEACCYNPKLILGFFWYHNCHHTICLCSIARKEHSLALGGLLGSLGDLALSALLLGDGLDDTYSNGLSHVTYGETSKRSVV